MKVTMEEVKDRLLSFGYTVKDDDLDSLTVLQDKVERRVQNLCHRQEMPEELRYYVIDRVCGEFLWEKKQSGLLTDVVSEKNVSSLREGDVTVSFFQGDSAADRLDKLIAFLMGSEEEILCYRKLNW